MSSLVLQRLTVGRIQTFASISCALIIIGLYTIPFFRALSSIGLALLVVSAISYGVVYRKAAQQRKWPVYVGLALVFVMHLLAGLNTSHANAGEYWRDIVLQLPFLLLPLSFWLLPPLPVTHLSRLYKLLLALTALSAAGSTGYYLLNTSSVNELYIHSKVMPTVPDHIRFSLLVALSIAVGAVLLNRRALQGWRRVTILLITLFLAGYLHLLAVRSGLLAFYVLGCMAVAYLAWRKVWIQAAALLAILMVLPFVSYWLLPTFYNKYHNTREDVSKVEQTQSANNYSLVGRKYSYQAAVLVVKDNPLVGVGKADLREEMSARYRTYFPQIDADHHIQPHNQYLFYLVSFGVLGLLLFMAGFYYPLYWARYRQAPLLVAQYVIVTLSFMVEPTLESQTGLTFALFFLLLPLGSLGTDEDKYPVTRGPEWRPA